MIKAHLLEKHAVTKYILQVKILIVPVKTLAATVQQSKQVAALLHWLIISTSIT
jgi:hypothetical protein